MSKEITKKETTAIALPSDAPTGFEDFSNDDLIVPRLNLLQDTSKPVKAKKASSGNFYNNLTEEEYKSPLDVVFISAKQVATYLVMGEGLVCKSADRITSIHGDVCAQCPHGVYWNEWKDDVRPGCSAGIEVFTVKRDTLLQPIPTIMVASFSGSSHKAMKQHISKLKFRGKSLYSNSVLLESELAHAKKGDYYNYKLSESLPLNQEELNVVLSLYKTFISGNVVVHEDEPKTPSSNEAFKRPSDKLDDI